MKVLIHLWCLLLLGLLPGCGNPTDVQPAGEPIDFLHGHLLHAQPKLPTVTVKVGDKALVAEIAREQLQIATGMMYRTNMAENEAMLFVFPKAEQRSFYMRNCVIPLSGAYISPKGEVLQIIEMQPRDERGIPSKSDNVQFVLEVPQGWFARHNVTTGAQVRTERGTLQETFFGGQ